MIDYRQLSAFASVIEEQSFEKAARSLHLTQSAISQRVKLLEESLGQLLIIRGQPPQPTPAGQQLLRHFRQVSLLQSDVLQSLGDAYAKGFTKLAIGVNADSLATWFMDAIEPLLEKNSVLLALRVDDQDQTHHLLRQGEVIGCISASDQPMQGIDCTELGTMRYQAVATPDFIERYFPDGICAAGFERAPAAEFNHKDQLQDRYLKALFDQACDYPRHHIPSPQSFVDLIIRGHAWGMIPDLQSRALLRQGILQPLSPGPDIYVPLYWRSWSLKTDIGRQLTESLKAYCRSHLEPI